MKGRYALEIESRKVIYQLHMERKVTVIKGNSGTGKSSMIRILSDYVELGKDSGVRIRKNSDYEIKILENRSDWVRELEQIHNSIIFVDEDVQIYQLAVDHSRMDCVITEDTDSGYET